MEVLIIDSSDEDRPEAMVIAHANQTVLRSRPSVCAQRNLGIKEAKAPYILLCDDDLELPPDYLEQTYRFMVSQPDEGAVTGLWVQPDENGIWRSNYPPTSWWQVLAAWLFGHSLWGSPADVRAPRLVRPLFRYTVSFYARKGNFIAKSGWPVNTHFHEDQFKVAVTSLGSALIKKDWLMAAPFEERLDAHGYGDNYGVCVQLPRVQPVNVLSKVVVKHHQSQVNRLDRAYATFRRVMALHYFLNTTDRFGFKNKLFFAWSLLGHVLLSGIRKKSSVRKAYQKALGMVLLGKNPYVDR